MLKLLSLPKLDETQRRMVAAISSDLGKLFFAAGVVSYFIPALEHKVTPYQLLLGLLLALSFFIFAIKLSKET